jgi:hypothetical protein
MRNEARPSFAGPWAGVACLVALALWSVPRCIVAYDGISFVPEPAEWRAWPLEDANAMRRPWVVGDAAGGHGDRFQVPNEDWVRHDPKGPVYVVASTSLSFLGSDIAGEERFVVAFRRDGVRSFAFTSARGAAFVAALGLELVVMILGIAVARRRLTRAARLAASLESSYVSLAADPPTYRRPDVPGDPGAVEACLAEGASGANRALGMAFVTLSVIFGGFLAAAAYVVVAAWFRCVV